MFTLPPTSVRLRLTGSAFAITLTALLITGLLGAREAAFGLGGDASLPSIGSLVPDDSLDPRIVALDLDGRGWNNAVGRLDSALFDRAETVRHLAVSRTRLIETRAELDVVRDELEQARGTVVTVTADIAELESVLRARALRLFVSHGEGDRELLVSATRAADEARISQLAAEVDDSQFAARRTLLEQQSSLESGLSALSGQRIALDTIAMSLAAAIESDEQALGALDAEINLATDAVRIARRNAHIPGMDFSVVALDAYLRAETLLADQSPDCGLEWWMIAGIGRVESRHGRLGGRSIRADGTSDTPIIGVVLDGGPGVRAVVDTDDGALDDDPEWDRAVGPMQFIPETWRIRSADGSGDGIRDPHNIYDAAFTAGRYLCRLGGDLSGDHSLRSAYYGYNTSISYVETVSQHSLRYSELALGEVPGDREDGNG